MILPYTTSSADSRVAKEVEFKRFNSLPEELRRTIWKYSIPRGRIVDVVFDRNRDRYCSFYAVVPAALHASKESRTVALRVYTLCFGTQSNPAAIPVDQIFDCILFEDWLVPLPGTSAHELMSSGQEYWDCQRELQRLIGPVGQIELGIRRVAISIDFYSLFEYDGFVQSLRYLFGKLPKIDTLVFVLEERDPYTQGVVYFSELDFKAFCCPDCYCDIKSYIGTASQEALIHGKDATWADSGEVRVAMAPDNSLRVEAKEIQLRFRGIYRGGQLQPIKLIERCFKSGEDEILQPSDGDASVEEIACAKTSAVDSIRGDSKKEDNQMQGKLEEEDDEDLGDGELEGLLADNKSWEVFGSLAGQ
ncbi:hypothetical protein V8E51_001327 [Hyaloscypha variabilis]